MKNFISNKVEAIEISGIRKFYNKVAKVENAISLTLGQPDFNVPVRAKEAMIKAIEENKTTYTPNAGIEELREEITKYLKTMDINYSSEDVCVTVGGSEGLMCIFSSIINEGDKILIPNPAYPAYEACVKLLGGEVVNYNLDDKFLPDVLEIERLIEEEKPKAIVISYPCNPTGTILTKEYKEKLENLLKHNDIVIISDEMYSALSYAEDYYSLAQCEELKEKLILVSGFSKIFSMTGMRVGYVCSQEPFTSAILKVHQYNVSCAPSICQWAALEGLRHSLEDVDYMRNKFIERKNYLCTELRRLGFEVVEPKGAFYIFPSIKNFNMSSEEFCERLLEKEKVAIIPGTAFGSKGEGYVRISYSYSLDKLKEAVYRIEKFLNSLK